LTYQTLTIDRKASYHYYFDNSGWQHILTQEIFQFYCQFGAGCLKIKMGACSISDTA